MSFYLDDDDPYFPSSNNIFKEEQEGFICENCGGTDSYIDASTGAHCCASCFTQSQSAVPATQDAGAGESALEFEDVMGLAARTRRGRLVQQRPPTARTSGGNGWKQCQPLEELDHTVALPDLITCLWALQRVLHRATVRVVELLATKQNSDSHESSLPMPASIRQNVVTTVQTMWNKYLAMWQEGAEYYGRRHPEIRFSFRDLFLTTINRTLVLRHLSHQAALRARKELEVEEESDTDQSESSSSSDASIKPIRTNSTRIHPTSSLPQKKARLNGAIRRLLLKFYPKAKGRKEAALFLQPSMSLCAAIIWLAVRHLGITPSHIVTWIANGSLPLINAFDSVLYPTQNRRQLASSSTGDEDQDDDCQDDDEKGSVADTATRRKASLQVIANFFRMNAPPRLAYLEHLAKLMAFCTGVPPSKDSGLPVSTDMVVQNSRNRKPQWYFRLISPQTLPIVTARMIADLGLSQQVLNMALALMGLYPTASTTQSPAHSSSRMTSHPAGHDERQNSTSKPPTLPLKRAQHLTNPVQVAGVIVVACKLCPGWETWVYRMAHRPSQQLQGQQDEQCQAKRFVPWNDQELRLLCNQSSMESYLDFIEENLEKKDGDLIFPNFFDTFPQNSTLDNGATPDWRSLDLFTSFSTHRDDAPDAKQEDAVVVAGDRNPNQPAIQKRRKHHAWNFTIKKPSAVWAEVNGLGEYVVYRSMAKRRRGHVNRGMKLALPYQHLEALHPHYVLLLEYVSYISRLPIRTIHAFVAELDAEIHQNTSSRRKRKRESL
jgi:hypothetical protein